MPTIKISPQEAEFFLTYGYLVLPKALSAQEVGRLRAEVEQSLGDAFDIPSALPENVTGAIGYYLPLMGKRSPLSRMLCVDEHLVSCAERLLGSSVLPKSAKGILYEDASPWHADSSDFDLRAIKVVTYFDDLAANSGALRVLPCSHNPSVATILASYRQNRPVYGREFEENLESAYWPGLVVTSSPGDLIIFDAHLWHASLYGRNRLQWSVSFVALPTNSHERDSTIRYINSFDQTVRAYDGQTYPYFDIDWFKDNSPALAATWLELGLMK